MLQAGQTGQDPGCLPARPVPASGLDVPVQVRPVSRPVSWPPCDTLSDGSLGMLYVLEDWRGQGLARQLVRAMVQRAEARGDWPYIHIEEDNLPSKKLFNRYRPMHYRIS